MKVARQTARVALALTAVGVASAVLAQDHPEPPPSPAPADAEARVSPRVGGLLRPILRQRLDLVLELLNGRYDRMEELVFTEDLEAETPVAGVRERIRGLAHRAGGFTVLETRQLEPTVMGAWLRMNAVRRSLWILKVGIEVMPPRRINRFELARAPLPGVDSTALWSEFDAMLKGQPFTTSFLAVELRPDGGRKVLHAVNPDQRLGIGLMGTLWAHLALSELVADGGEAWNRPLAFDESLRSLPASATTNVEPGTELPLWEYAARAMRDNDSTAAEHLIALLGRERIEQARDGVRARAAAESGEAGPPGGEPFLTPLEFHKLKCGVTNLVMRYADSMNDARRRLLADEVPQAVVDPMLYHAWRSPQALDTVGWQASARELVLALCRLKELASAEGGERALEALTPPPRADTPAEWWTRSARRTAGEPGALACLWLLEDPTGRTFVMALIFNRHDRPLNSPTTAAIAAKALENMASLP